MAVSTGTVNKRFISAITYMDQREIEKNVVDIQNEGAFLDGLKVAGRYVPSSEGDYHHFTNSKLFGTPGDTTGATIVGSGSATQLTGVTLTEATSGFAIVGTECILPNGKVAVVSAKTTGSGQDTLTLDSVDGANLTLVAGNKIAFVSNAQEEGSSAPASRRYDWTKYYNKLQIFRERDVITDVQKASKIEASVGGEQTVMYVNHLQKLAALKGQIAAAFIGGQMSAASWSDASPSLVGANGNSIQTTRGLHNYVVSYGINDTLTSAGTVAIGDIQDLVVQMAAARCPDEYMVWLNTAAYGVYSQFMKGLNSSGVYSGRLSLDGKQLDLEFEGFKYSGKSFEFSKLGILDHSELFNFTGSAGIQKNAYFIPKGNVNVQGGGSLPRIRVRYFEQPMEGGLGDGIIKESHQGLLAPTPVGTDANFTADWYTIQGLEILGAQHFVKQVVLA
jgi:hypothetical protein